MIKLSNHFTYSKLIRFTLPSIGMMIFTSIYSIVDGFFVSNFAGDIPFKAVNLIMPFLMILATPLAKIFVSYNDNLVDMTVNGFRIFAISFPFMGYAIFGSGFFTSLNDGTTSAIISFLRTLVFQIGAVILLPLIWKLNGIWASVVIAEIMAVVFTIIFLIVKKKKYNY